MNINSHTYKLIQKVLKENPHISVGDVGRLIKLLER